jgi:hypothetical protein
MKDKEEMKTKSRTVKIPREKREKVEGMVKHSDKEKKEYVKVCKIKWERE